MTEINVDKLIEKLNDIEKKKIECDLKLKMLKEEKEKILNELKELNIDPKDIDEEIKSIEAEIQSKITLFETL
jgi:predicted nuclease with TOPRIM domain